MDCCFAARLCSCSKRQNRKSSFILGLSILAGSSVTALADDSLANAFAMPSSIRSKGSSGTFGFAWMSMVSSREIPGMIPIWNYVIVVRSAKGALVARQHSDAKGKFKICLRPGTYILRPVLWQKDGKKQYVQYGDKETVAVQADTFSKVELHFP